jgi:nitrite reductase (NO-forming)/hydroxylamine reductase
VRLRPDHHGQSLATPGQPSAGAGRRRDEAVRSWIRGLIRNNDNTMHTVRPTHPVSMKAVALAALGLLAALAGPLAAAQDKPAHPSVSGTEARYQNADASPLVNEPMYQSTNPKAPPMTQAEFELGRKTYFERCAGCHGVLRKGATGKPLTPDITLGKGTDYLKVFISYGSPAGMPNWLTSGELDEKTVDIMARYIQQEPPLPPEWGMEDMKKSWKVVIPPSSGRPRR